MNWKLKCAAFKLVERLPFGGVLHRLMQRYTGRYFQKLTPEVLKAYDFHIANFPGGIALEFGAGRNLLVPLLLSNAGATKVYALDLHRHATLEQVRDTIRQLRAFRPGTWPEIMSLDDLLTLYRIDYRAPADARTTGLPAASADFIYSTSTLEHIPEGSIRDILTECRRIAKSDAVMSFTIDYHDHYSSFDRQIGPWNFYQYADAEWARYNPSAHYQNRLRHSDHQRIFQELGLVPLIDRRIMTTIEPLAVCEKFAGYSREDLLAMNGHFMLRVHS